MRLYEGATNKTMPEKYKNKYTIKSARLECYDYSQNGMYFITICTKNREENFGKIENGKMILSEIGKIAEQFYQEIPNHFPFVVLDQHVIMPNHAHMVLEINWETQSGVETQNFASLHNVAYKNKFGPQSKNLASIIRGYKVGVKKYATMNGIDFAWQPRFYDHIIRNEISLNKIREYIQTNPEMWERDRNNVENIWM